MKPSWQLWYMVVNYTVGVSLLLGSYVLLNSVR